jgi:phospholipase C
VRRAALALLAGGAVLPLCAAGAQSASTTTTPIRHLIVVIGENQTFDALFATWKPANGARVNNLLSEGIVEANGSPGPNFARAVQRRSEPAARFSIDPPRGAAYPHLPQPTLIGVKDLQFNDVGTAPDGRFPADLQPGPFPISRYVPYPHEHAAPTLAISGQAMSAATGDPVHRFFQMWQQCGVENRDLGLYTWVAVTAGMGGDTSGVRSGDTGQGGELMGFLNMAGGDAPYFRALADGYASSDNYHQPMMGGTAMNFFMLVSGDVPYYELAGHPAQPPANQIENPDPAPGSENFYLHDGYEGGSYVNCADRSSAGVSSIMDLLDSRRIASRCEPEHWYLVNNLAAGFDLDGHPQPLGPDNFNYPPQSVPTIADALSDHGVSWKWYIGARDRGDLRVEMRTLHLSLEAARRAQYNNDGDPLVASDAIMTNPTRRARLQGLQSFYDDLEHGTLPQISFVVPKARDSGHPGSSVIANYENLLRDLVARVQRKPGLWADTAIIATTDEGGGDFDSGYIQPLDFFGDGPRVPLLVISPFSRRGHVDHTYNDHVSILKFIERNWRLAPLSPRSRDNLPDPATDPADPYRPANGPAIGDLMTLFDF